MSGASPQLDDGYLQSLMGDFLDESSGLVRQLNEHLLHLEELVQAANGGHATPTPAVLNEMFRAAHSIKGLSGMLRLDQINGLTHKIENVFEAARSGHLPISGEVVDVVFQAVGRLETMIELLAGADGDPVDCDETLAAIEAVLQASGASRTVVSQAHLNTALAALSHAEVPEAPPEIRQPAPAESQPAPSPLAGVQDDDDVPPKYLGIFIDESDLTLEELSAALLAGPDVAVNEALLVGCHRLKGSAASIGLHRIARLAHFMEDLLQDKTRAREALSVPIADALLKCIDAVRSFIAGIQSGNRVDQLDEACSQLLSVSQQASPPPPTGRCAPKPATAAEDDALQQVAAQAPEHVTGYAGHIAFEPGLALVELKAQLLLEKLHRSGALFYCQPPEDHLDSVSESSSITFGIETDSGLDQLEQTLRIEGVATVTLRPIRDRSASGPTPPQVDCPSQESLADAAAPAAPAASSAESAPAAAAATTAKNKPTETLRVDIDRLDQLMNLAGQLVINKARFSQIGSRIKQFSAIKSSLNTISSAHANATRLSTEVHELAASQPALPIDSLCSVATQLIDDLASLQAELGQLSQMRTVLNDLSEAVHQLDRVSDGIQTTVMDTRMVPIGPLFARFKRVVRDLARVNDKQITLELLGEATELDKRMIDELGDPLIHLIRNSADHGIEMPAARVAAGKPAGGRITLNAFHRGNRIVIRISDDGKGLDPQKIRAKALSKGLIHETEAERMSDQQIYQLIWQPGFSTAEKITEVSGRGMGMDIVRFKVEQLNGTVELFSEPGRGATFEIKLPLTMAILPSLMIVVGVDVFAVPVESVVEIVRLPAGELPTVHGRRTACIRGRIISLVELDELFSWNEPSRGKDNVERQEATLVIVGTEGQEIGLVVDSLIGEQDIVIKSLEENFRNVDGIAGASILGDGRVSLILDVSALVEMSRRTQVSLAGRLEPNKCAQPALVGA